MNETHVTIVGNALHSPDWRRTASGALVSTFKIASTARRYHQASGRWIDGNSLRVRVSCWRSLAENVKNSVTSGDPLIVSGRLFTRDWQDRDGVKRTSWELDATAIGHDLSKGRAVFERKKAQTVTSEADGAEADQRVGGELTEPVPDEEAPTQFNDMPFDEALEDGLSATPWEASMVEGEEDPVDVFRNGGLATEPVASYQDEVASYQDEYEPASLGEPPPPPVAPAPVIEDGNAGEPDPAGSGPADQPASTGEPVPSDESRSGRRRGLRRRT